MAIPRHLKQLLNLPTAAFAEDEVTRYIKSFCEKQPHVTLKRDRYGNLLARYRNKPRSVTPLVFSAHTDHPAFVAERMVGAKALQAAFRGGVLEEYFPGSKVRFWEGGRWIAGTVQAVTKADTTRRGLVSWRVPTEVNVHVSEPVEPGAVGVWDLPEPHEKDGLLHAPVCDDLAGCAAMLALLERLEKKNTPAEVLCLFTRAEEVGFVGAIGAAKARTIPKKLPIIAIEMSSALPDAPIGAGPILRVGDRLSIFTPAVTDFCNRVALARATKSKKFRYQRKLMDGGSCESTAFVAYGYQANGICLALGNYHNMNKEKQRIACEYISLDDWKLMVDWFELLVNDKQGYGPTGDAVVSDLDKRFGKWEGLL